MQENLCIQHLLHSCFSCAVPEAQAFKPQPVSKPFLAATEPTGFRQQLWMLLLLQVLPAKLQPRQRSPHQRGLGLSPRAGPTVPQHTRAAHVPEALEAGPDGALLAKLIRERCSVTHV